MRDRKRKGPTILVVVGDNRKFAQLWEHSNLCFVAFPCFRPWDAGQTNFTLPSGIKEVVFSTCVHEKGRMLVLELVAAANEQRQDSEPHIAIIEKAVRHPDDLRQIAGTDFRQLGKAGWRASNGGRQKKQKSVRTKIIERIVTGVPTERGSTIRLKPRHA